MELQTTATLLAAGSTSSRTLANSQEKPTNMHPPPALNMHLQLQLPPFAIIRNVQPVSVLQRDALPSQLISRPVLLLLRHKALLLNHKSRAMRRKQKGRGKLQLALRSKIPRWSERGALLGRACDGNVWYHACACRSPYACLRKCSSSAGNQAKTSNCIVANEKWPTKRNHVSSLDTTNVDAMTCRNNGCQDHRLALT